MEQDATKLILEFFTDHENTTDLGNNDRSKQIEESKEAEEQDGEYYPYEDNYIFLD